MTTPSQRKSPERVPWRHARALVGWSLFGVGCSNLLGIPDDNNKVDCLKTSDCGAGFVCENTRCVCTTCGHGGASGTGGTGGTGGSIAGQSGEPPVMSASGAGGSRAGTGGVAAGEGGTTNHGSGGTQTRGGTGGSATSGGGEAGQGGESATSGGGAGGEAGFPGVCDPSAKSCLVCDETGNYKDGETPCAEACKGKGECVYPPSCNGLGKICSGQDCCRSLPIPPGQFLRSCDLSCQEFCGSSLYFPAEISAFALDQFEVTVGRFRRFVYEYPASKPLEHSGKNPHNPDDDGWNAVWTASLPTDAADFRAKLGNADCAGLWTDTVEGNEPLPINCVTWYEAQAFCIWDGGRLPTEAEWNYVASGGQSRLYPWSTPSDSSIDQNHAVYQVSQPGVVGLHPLGRGRWQQDDLAGNVSEWIWDGSDECYTYTYCEDCGKTDASQEKRIRGGDYSSPAASLQVAERKEADASARNPSYGFRCARDF